MIRTDVEVAICNAFSDAMRAGEMDAVSRAVIVRIRDAVQAALSTDPQASAGPDDCELCDGVMSRACPRCNPCADGATTISADGDKVLGAVADIVAERRRQIEAEGWTPEHDDEHGAGEMAAAAAAYAFSAATEGRYYAADPLGFWPWDAKWWKPKGARRDLVRAGALIVAEIERLDRAAATSQTEAGDGA
jgi:hypothetical protein